MSAFFNNNFTDLMLNWMDVLNSNKSIFNVAESTNASDSKLLPKSDVSRATNRSKKLPKKPKQIKKQKQKEKQKQKQKQKNKKRNSARNCMISQLSVFEMSTNTSNDILLDIQHGNEGFDLHIGQTVCDDSRPSMGEEASSYFLMRHSFTYPGPLMTMLQGPMAAITGGYGYRISAEAVHREKYVLVGTYSNNTVEGVWEHTWNKNIKSHLTFIAGFESAQQRQMAALMAQQQGLPAGGAGANQSNKFPAAISYIDYKTNNLSTRLHLDMMNNQLSLSFNRRLYSLSKDLQIGTRIVSSYEKRKSLLEFGGKYQWRSRGMTSIQDNNNNNNIEDKNDKKKVKGKVREGLNTIEAMYNMDTYTLQLMYSKNITENAALTSRLMWKTSTFGQLMASIGYKYQFGRHMGLSKTICGEIAADGNFRQMITFPVLGNMICKFYAEINHFLSPQQVQQGQFPHKFGLQLNIHL